MARQRRGERVLGPYSHRDGWRLILVGDDGTRIRQAFASKAEAEEIKQQAEKALKKKEERTLEMALEDYKTYLERKANKPVSVETTMYRMARFFPDQTLVLRDFTKEHGDAHYEALVSTEVSVDYHRGCLNQAKSFFNWCCSKGWLKVSPLANVQAIGRRKAGKPQLRISEARKLHDTALRLAESEDEGAIVSLVVLLLGVRASEVVDREVRDIDDDGRVFCVPDAKTQSGRRELEVPEPLASMLDTLAQSREGKELFPGRDRHWVRRQVKRLCKAAGVPPVTAHGLRGTHASLAKERGTSSHDLAHALGHSSPAVTNRHYARRESAERGRNQQVLSVLQGGRA